MEGCREEERDSEKGNGQGEGGRDYAGEGGRDKEGE